MRKVTVLFIALIINCAAPIHNSSNITKSVSVKNNVLPDTTTSVSSSPQSTTVHVDSFPSPPESYSIEQWVGKEFVVLQRQQMFINFGYEFYLSEAMENCKMPVDSSIELKNHRIRCDKLSGHVLKIKGISFLKPEWICTFFDSTLGKNIYGKTYKSAIKELVLKNDLESAKKRWLGKVIFSKRGVLSTNDSKNGYGSLKVQIQDPLTVYDICWGVTPLPVKPLWLLVEAPGKKKGFIPVRISWTNIMSDMSRDGAPWEEDILEKDPMVQFNWEPAVWELLNNHRVIVGMNRDQVLLSWGRPLEIFHRELEGISYECWKYQSQVVYFNNSKIQAIKNE